MAEFAGQGACEPSVLERVKRAFEGLRFRRIIVAVRLGHVSGAEPRVASMADEQIRRKVVDACPHCGGELLLVEGVAHRARTVELDEEGAIHAVEFADPKPVSYHRLTWIECAANCDSSQSEGMDSFFEQ